jgi:hypothetical protein
MLHNEIKGQWAGFKFHRVRTYQGKILDTTLTIANVYETKTVAKVTRKNLR